MPDPATPFKNLKVVPYRLVPFGFSENGECYTYSADLVGGQFKMTLAVTREGKVSTEVTDASSGERYVLQLNGGDELVVSLARAELHEDITVLYFRNNGVAGE